MSQPNTPFDKLVNIILNLMIVVLFILLVIDLVSFTVAVYESYSAYQIIALVLVIVALVAIVNRGLSLLGMPSREVLSKDFIALAIMAVWFVLVWYLSQHDFFKADSKQLPLYLTDIILGLLFVVILFFSKFFRGWLESIPVYLLIYFLTLRVLAIPFLVLWYKGELPPINTLPVGLSGLVFGSTAPVVGYWLASGKPWARTVALWWNVLGLLSQVLVLVLDAITLPMTLQTMDNVDHLLESHAGVEVFVYIFPIMMVTHLAALWLLLKKGKKA